MPLAIRHVFLVNVLAPRLLILMHGPFVNPDLIHIGKCAEAAALKALSGGVRVGTLLFVSCLLKAELFSMARLFAINHEFRDIIRCLTPETMRYFASIPGEISHRLKIITTLAAVFDEFRVQIGFALEVFNTMYSPKGNWKASGGGGPDVSNRQSTLAHAREVYLGLSDPRMRVWCSFLRRMHPFSVLWYAVFQDSGGFIANRVRTEANELISLLDDQCERFDVHFYEVAQLAREVMREAAEAGVLAHLQKITKEAEVSAGTAKAGTVEVATQDAPAAHLYADGEGGTEDAREAVRAAANDPIIDAVTGDDANPVPQSGNYPAPEEPGALHAGADDVAVVAAPVTAATADVPPAPDEDAEADDGDFDFEGFDGGCLKAALQSDVPITADIADDAIVRDLRAYLAAMSAYLKKRMVVYEDWPLRIASYWCPKRGGEYLIKDWHKLGKCGGRNGACDQCRRDGGMDEADYLESGAWMVGFWDHPDLSDEIKAAVERGRPIVVPGGQDPDEISDLPRGGVNLGANLDEFYQAYFFQSPHSMYTERGLGVMKRLNLAGGHTTEIHADTHMRHRNWGGGGGGGGDGNYALTDDNREEHTRKVTEDRAKRTAERYATGADADGYLANMRTLVQAANERTKKRDEIIERKAREKAMTEETREKKALTSANKLHILEVAKKKSDENRARSLKKNQQLKADVTARKQAGVVLRKKKEVVQALNAHEVRGKLDSYVTFDNLIKPPPMKDLRYRLLDFVDDDSAWLCIPEVKEPWCTADDAAVADADAANEVDIEYTFDFPGQDDAEINCTDFAGGIEFAAGYNETMPEYRFGSFDEDVNEINTDFAGHGATDNEDYSASQFSTGDNAAYGNGAGDAAAGAIGATVSDEEEEEEEDEEGSMDEDAVQVVAEQVTGAHGEGTLRPTTTNGDCFYHSVEMAIAYRDGDAGPHTAASLRKTTSDALKAVGSEDRSRPLYLDSYNQMRRFRQTVFATLEDVAEHVAISGNWASTLEQEIVAQHVGLPIVVLRESGANTAGWVYNAAIKGCTTLYATLTASGSAVLQNLTKLPVVVQYNGKDHFEFREPPTGQRFVLRYLEDVSQAGRKTKVLYFILSLAPTEPQQNAAWAAAPGPPATVPDSGPLPMEVDSEGDFEEEDSHEESRSLDGGGVAGVDDGDDDEYHYDGDAAAGSGAAEESTELDPILQASHKVTRSGRRTRRHDYSELLGKTKGTEEGGTHVGGGWCGRLAALPRLAKKDLRPGLLLGQVQVAVRIKIAGRWVWWRARVTQIYTRGDADFEGALKVMYDTQEQPEKVELSDYYIVIAPSGCPEVVKHGE